MTSDRKAARRRDAALAKAEAKVNAAIRAARGTWGFHGSARLQTAMTILNDEFMPLMPLMLDKLRESFNRLPPKP